MNALVAPYAGAWIEIEYGSDAYFVKMSLPTRERGLKLIGGLRIHIKNASLPTRERGLKLCYI